MAEEQDSGTSLLFLMAEMSCAWVSLAGTGLSEELGEAVPEDADT